MWAQGGVMSTHHKPICDIHATISFFVKRHVHFVRTSSDTIVLVSGIITMYGMGGLKI